MALRSVIYARQSLDRTGEGAAVERQVKDCKALAKARGWQVVDTVIDNDVSASSGKARPGYQRVLGMIEAGQVDRVVVWAVDRLTRRMRDLEDVVDLCESTGVAVATVSGDIDLSTDMGRMVARILASVARGEVERKGARQKRANLQRAEAGNVGWTIRPFGYERTDGQVHVVEAEADELREAAKRVLAGDGLKSICADMNARGQQTSVGGTWRPNTLCRLLLSPRHAGMARYLGADMGPGQWPAIFDPDTHEQLTILLRDPRRLVQTSTAVKYLLSGLARCGRCEAKMWADGKDALVYRCKACGLARRRYLVDDLIERIVVERLSRPDAADLFTTRPDDVNRLRSEAVTLRERRDQLAELLADGLLAPAKVREQTAKIADRLRDIETSLARELSDHPVRTLTAAKDIARAWEALPLTSRRTVVSTLMDVSILPAGKGVRWHPDQIKIEWRSS